MKKVLVVSALVLGIVAAALVPGMDKRMYGGSVLLFPFPGAFAAGAGGYYMEGREIYKFEDMSVFIDGYAGGGFAADFIFVPMAGSGLGVEIDLRGSAVVYKRDFSFEMFGYKFIPALKVDARLYWDVVGANLMGYIFGNGSAVGFRVDPYLTAVVEWEPDKNRYVSFHFWPYPLIFGVDIWEM